MIFDPVFFDSTMYETANDAVLFCWEYLEKSVDNAHIASALAIICPVTDERMAVYARDALLRAQARVQGEAAQEYVRIALNTLERALAGERATRSAA